MVSSLPADVGGFSPVEGCAVYLLNGSSWSVLCWASVAVMPVCRHPGWTWRAGGVRASR